MRAIDTLHLGRRRWICCWQVGQVLVDPGPTLSLENVLAELDGWQPQAILLTHIHFDHAGGTGTLMRMFPELEVYVHELGAAHMVDPTRLWASAARLYGEENMLSMWGEFAPVPDDRLHELRGGETLNIGGDTFEVAYTPGHASHHVSYLHEGTAFVGDVGGVRIESGDANASADTAARHRRGGVASLDRVDPGLEARAPCGHSLRRLRRSRAAARRAQRTTRPLGRVGAVSRPRWVGRGGRGGSPCRGRPGAPSIRYSQRCRSIRPTPACAATGTRVNRR